MIISPFDALFLEKEESRPHKGAWDFGGWLFAQEPTFLKSVPSIQELPLTDLPEIAFAGRSNVGKSSLINGLFNRHDMARTSNTPGRTQLLNFFNVIDRLMVVDLPGYGYAEAPKDNVASWNKLIRLYLRGRGQLRRVYLLIDSRHGIKKLDNEIMDMLDEGAVSYQIILTKADKISNHAFKSVLADTRAKLAGKIAAHPIVLGTSSEKKWGIDMTRWQLAMLSENAGKR